MEENDPQEISRLASDNLLKAEEHKLMPKSPMSKRSREESTLKSVVASGDVELRTTKRSREESTLKSAAASGDVELRAREKTQPGDAKFVVTKQVPELQDGRLDSFYHGTLTRDETVQLLRGKPVKTFLIRWSERNNNFVVSFINEKHVLTHNSLYVLGEDHGVNKGKYCCKPNGIGTIYEDLVAFVVDFQERGILTRPVPCEAR